ncbi:hypothetical protein ACLMJK_008047 [Lecanora helva]
MADPSSLVPPGLLRHIHLISSYQFPKLPQFNLDLVVEYLIQASRIVKEQAPMNWMFLSCPQDGDVLLVWQPPQMGTREASDGYVWGDPESAFSSEMRGYKVEMYVHRTGFRAPNEPMATHARRRLRLTPSQNPDPNTPPPDPSLWIMHYCQTEPQNQFPSRNIQISDHVRQMMSERGQLQRCGQLVRKEFMLRDNASWPTINLPGNAGSAHPQQAMGYPNDVMAHMNRSQQQAYIQQQQQQQANASQRGIGPSPAKRPRHGGPGQGSATAIPAPIVSNDSVNEDEDGTIGGDYMDYLTPRDISLQRYIQHHEWLEQILESPYHVDQIIPGDLGLGRKGELESLTKDFFDAPTDGTPERKLPLEDPPGGKEDPPQFGRLGAGKAGDFTKRANEKVAQINSEMEKLKRQHTRRMAKLERFHALKTAEERIRVETLEILNGDTTKIGLQQDGRIDDITNEIFGKGVQSVPDVECLHKGGLEEKSTGKESSDQDYTMVDQFNLDSTLDEAQPELPTIPMARNPSSKSTASNGQVPTVQATGQGAVDFDEKANAAAPPKDTASEDWIMVNKDENPTQANQDEDLGDINSFVNDAAMQSVIHTPAGLNDASENQPQAFEHHEEATNEIFDQNPRDEHQAEDFGTNDFGEGIDFGDLDTAGDALSGFPEANENDGLDEHDMGANDGAFIDAFPPAEQDSGNQASGP